LLLMLVVVQ